MVFAVFDSYAQCIIVCKNLLSFSYGRKTEISYPSANFQKNYRLERAQNVFLDRSKTLGFRDVSKIEILQVTVLRMLTVR